MRNSCSIPREMRQAICQSVELQALITDESSLAGDALVPEAPVAGLTAL